MLEDQSPIILGANEPRSNEMPGEPETTVATCSARGCAKSAVFDLQWNNPRIHTPDRRKHWLACGDHRESLGAFLSARGFLSDIVPL